MKILIIIGILLIICMYYLYRVEGFVSEEESDPILVKKYNKFATFYNSFMSSWKKAIITSIGLDTPVQPLTSPSQISKASFSTPTQDKMNEYVVTLSKKMNKLLPPVTDDISQYTTLSALKNVIKKLLMDPLAYQNALDWMNNGLETAQQQLESMKKAPEGFEGFNEMIPFYVIEPFDDCEKISKCMMAAEDAKAVKEQAERDEIGKKLDKFNNDAALQKSITQNAELVEKSKKIQEQAQSGDLLNQMNLGGKEASQSHYVLPDGSNDLEEMKESDPDKYNTYKDKYKQMFSLSGLFTSINNNLR